MTKKKYYIKIVTDGLVCYLTNVDNGKITGVTAKSASLAMPDILQFDSYGEASQYAIINKLQSYKYYIIDNADLLEEMAQAGVAKVQQKDLFYITNQVGWKLFYSIESKKYYFDNKEHFYCVWYDLESADKALKLFQKRFSNLVLKVEILKAKAV